MKKADILSMNPVEISALMAEMGQPDYRAGQIFGWLHLRYVDSFAAMKNLPLSLRVKLEECCRITPLTVVEKYVSKRDDTVKYLSELEGGVLIESVLMSYKHGRSVCISTQAGCRMGCVFCASGESGFQRNLTAGEMCSQVYDGAALLAGRQPSRSGGGLGATPPLIRSVVLMGCGEPLDNFAATLRFIELITHPKGMNLGQRHITVSTCGLVPEILALADMKPQFTLAVSLHAPTDDVREKLMPIAKQYPLGELIPACRFYAEKTRRRVTFEYALAKGVNDSPAQAKALAKLLRGVHCHVNLIPINKGRGKFVSALPKETAAFAKVLEEAKIPVTMRRSLGADVKAACGQLRAGAIPAFHSGYSGRPTT